MKREGNKVWRHFWLVFYSIIKTIANQTDCLCCSPFEWFNTLVSTYRANMCVTSFNSTPSFLSQSTGCFFGWLLQLPESSEGVEQDVIHRKVYFSMIWLSAFLGTHCTVFVTLNCGSRPLVWMSRSQIAFEWRIEVKNAANKMPNERFFQSAQIPEAWCHVPPLMLQLCHPKVAERINVF